MHAEQKEYRMVSVFLRGIPKEVRDRFKALCVMRGTTMREAVIEMMVSALEESPIPAPDLPDGFRTTRPEK